MLLEVISDPRLDFGGYENRRCHNRITRSRQLSGPDDWQQLMTPRAMHRRKSLYTRNSAQRAVPVPS